jgi:hypothetical protein
VFGFTVFLISYLEEVARGVKGTLKQGEQENSFGHYSSLGEQIEIRTSGNKQLLTTRTLQGQVMFHKACTQQFREGSWLLPSDSFTLTPLTEKT